jgi:hypothetical protein
MVRGGKPRAGEQNHDSNACGFIARNEEEAVVLCGCLACAVNEEARPISGRVQREWAA